MAVSEVFCEGQSVFFAEGGPMSGLSWASVLAGVHYMDTDQIWIRYGGGGLTLVSERLLIPAALGRTLEMTRRAHESLEYSGQGIRPLLEQHAEGQDSTAAGTASNLRALESGGLIFTSHRIGSLGVIFIATVSDRSRTAIFTPSDAVRYRHPLMP